MKQEDIAANLFGNDEPVSPRYSKSSQSNPDRGVLWSSAVSVMQESLAVPAKPSEEVTFVDSTPFYPGGRQSSLSAIPASDVVVSSIEAHPEGQHDDLEDSLHHNFPDEDVEQPNHLAHTGPSSPLTELARSTSPVRNRDPVVPTITTPRTAPRASRVGSSGQKPSQTPLPSNRKSTTPRSGGTGKSRRDSKSFAKVDPKSRVVSTGPLDDQASLKLALQLQQEEHGLRRRSK